MAEIILGLMGGLGTLLIWYEVDERQLGTGGWSQDEKRFLEFFTKDASLRGILVGTLFTASDPVIQCL